MIEECEIETQEGIGEELPENVVLAPSWLLKERFGERPPILAERDKVTFGPPHLLTDEELSVNI